MKNHSAIISEQLELFPLASKSQKPQISSIPGIHPKEKQRYRIVLDGVVLRDRLTIDEAIAAMGGES